MKKNMEIFLFLDVEKGAGVSYSGIFRVYLHKVHHRATLEYKPAPGNLDFKVVKV